MKKREHVFLILGFFGLIVSVVIVFYNAKPVAVPPRAIHPPESLTQPQESQKPENWWF